jgi:hypothetical protein
MFPQLILALLSISTIVAGAVFYRSTPLNPLARQFSAGCGLIFVALICVLGFGWPSVFTPVALMTLPAAILFAWIVFKPDSFRSKAVNVYLYLVFFLSATVFTFQMWWLLRAEF